MGSGDLSIPRPSASPPLAPKATSAKGKRTGRRLRERPEAGPSQQKVIIRHRNYFIEERNGEVLNAACACEIFREEVSERAMARKFMWEFFD
jgi:hypothetical protein